MTKGKVCKICKRYVPWGKRGMASHLKKKHKKGKRGKKGRLTKRQKAARKAAKTRKRNKIRAAAKARYQGSGLQRLNMARKAAKEARKKANNTNKKKDVFAADVAEAAAEALQEKIESETGFGD